MLRVHAKFKRADRSGVFDRAAPGDPARGSVIRVRGSVNGRRRAFRCVRFNRRRIADSKRQRRARSYRPQRSGHGTQRVCDCATRVRLYGYGVVDDCISSPRHLAPISQPR